jgi:hypothetical protein
VLPPVAINIEQIERELISPIPHSKGNLKLNDGGGSGHQTNDDIYIGSMEIRKGLNSDHDIQ